MKSTSHRIILSLLLPLFFVNGAATGNSYKPQWESTPGVMLYSLVFESGGEIVGTDSVLWPDGSSAMFQYVKTKNELYRCVDYHDKSFVETGNNCYRLKQWQR